MLDYYKFVVTEGYNGVEYTEEEIFTFRQLALYITKNNYLFYEDCVNLDNMFKIVGKGGTYKTIVERDVGRYTAINITKEECEWAEDTQGGFKERLLNFKRKLCRLFLKTDKGVK